MVLETDCGSLEQIYIWGWNKHGQLGLGHCIDQTKPQLVKSLENQRIKAVAAGGAHTVALTGNPQRNIHAPLTLVSQLLDTCIRLALMVKDNSD